MFKSLKGMCSRLGVHTTQVDVFSFGVVVYELLSRQVTSAVVSQSGDANMPELYANKVSCQTELPASLCFVIHQQTIDVTAKPGFFLSSSL